MRDECVGWLVAQVWPVVHTVLTQKKLPSITVEQVRMRAHLETRHRERLCLVLTEGGVTPSVSVRGAALRHSEPIVWVHAGCKGGEVWEGYPSGCEGPLQLRCQPC
jgi:hypothetical protein